MNLSYDTARCVPSRECKQADKCARRQCPGNPERQSYFDGTATFKDGQPCWFFIDVRAVDLVDAA